MEPPITGTMHGWLHGFAGPEIASIEAVPGPLPGCATTEP